MDYRGTPEYKVWEKSILNRDGFHCRIEGCTTSSHAEITAHHLDSFHWCEAKRHDINNGITLCKTHHRAFHGKYGCFDNTEAEFNEWVLELIDPAYIKPTIYLLIGCSGSGKSWVCNQLTDKFTYVSYDGVRKKNHIPGLLAYSDKPKLYDPPIKISTFFKRHSSRFNIICVAILESDEVVKSRVESRGGKWTLGLVKRNATIVKRAQKYSCYSGTSQEILHYLQLI